MQDWKRWTMVVSVLLVIWFSLLAFLYLKADEVTRDPCSICASYMNETATCTTKPPGLPVVRYYYANGSMLTDYPERAAEPITWGMPKLNFTLAE